MPCLVLCRSQLLYLLFLIAMAGGFVTAQYLYLWAQDVDPAELAAAAGAKPQVLAPLCMHWYSHPACPPGDYIRMHVGPHYSHMCPITAAAPGGRGSNGSSWRRDMEGSGSEARQPAQHPAAGGPAAEGAAPGGADCDQQLQPGAERAAAAVAAGAQNCPRHAGMPCMLALPCSMLNFPQQVASRTDLHLQPELLVQIDCSSAATGLGAMARPGGDGCVTYFEAWVWGDADGEGGGGEQLPDRGHRHAAAR